MLVGAPRERREGELRAPCTPANVAYFIEAFRDRDSGRLRLDPDDDIVAACVLTRDGFIANDAVRRD